MKTKTKKPGLTKDSSAEFNRHLHRISISEIQNLVRLLNEISLKEESFVRKRFARFGAHFEDTILFLERLNLLRRVKGEINLDSNLAACRVDEEGVFELLLVRHLFKSAAYIHHLRGFFSCFKKASKEFQIQFDSEIRRQYSGLRNVLLDLGVLTAAVKESCYSVVPALVPLFVDALSRSTITPSELQRILRLREEFGCKAEAHVLLLEKERLKKWPDLVRRIEHVSTRDVCAGYDILSFSPDGDVVEQRFIEVKAVSVFDFKFYWSRNEMEAAKAYGQRYFLYLLPASEKGFLSDELEIIQDPFEQLSDTKAGWMRREELVSFWR